MKAWLLGNQSSYVNDSTRKYLCRITKNKACPLLPCCAWFLKMLTGARKNNGKWTGSWLPVILHRNIHRYVLQCMTPSIGATRQDKRRCYKSSIPERAKRYTFILTGGSVPETLAKMWRRPNLENTLTNDNVPKNIVMFRKCVKTFELVVWYMIAINKTVL